IRAFHVTGVQTCALPILRRIMPSPRAAGFSLIEALVAMVILALSLGALYQAAAGATRNVRVDERYTYAVQIAQSLLAEHPFVQRSEERRVGKASIYWA